MNQEPILHGDLYEYDDVDRMAQDKLGSIDTSGTRKEIRQITMKAKVQMHNLVLVLTLLISNSCLATVVWDDWTAGNEVQSLCDQDGQLYCGTDGGLVVWDISNRSYVKYDMRDGLGDNWVVSTAVAPDGVLWVGCIRSLEKMMDTGTFQSMRFPEPITVTDLDTDEESRVWIGTDDGGVFCFYAGRLVQEDLGTKSLDVTAIAVDSEMGVWAATSGRGLMRYFGGEWKEDGPTNGSRSYADVEIDSFGRVWAIGKEYPPYDYLYVYDEGQWQSFTIELDDTYPIDMAVDGSGTVWLVHSQGLTCFDGQDWGHWSEIDGISLRDLTCVCASSDGDGIWVGLSNDGIVRITGGQAERWLTNDVITRSYGCPLALEGSRLWAGMERARIASYDSGLWQSIELAPPDSTASGIDSISVGPDGRKWARCVRYGLLAYDGETVEVYNYTNTPLRSFDGPATVDQNGIVWIFEGANGMWTFDGQSWSLFGYSDGFPLTRVFTMAETEDGVLWIGGSPGVCSFDGTTWTHYRPEDTPLFEYVSAIACSPYGEVYFGQNNLVCLDDSIWTVFTLENSGLSCHSIVALDVSENGVLWMGSGDAGLYTFDRMTWEHFTSDNSPLIDMQVDQILCGTDCLWISTAGGLCRRRIVNEQIDLTLSASVEGFGSLVVSADCDNKVGDVWGDVYLWVECPDGSFYFLPSLSQEPARLARKVHFTENLQLQDLPVFSCDTSSIPAGRYTFKLIIMNRNSTTEPLSNIASCEWEFVK